MLGVALISLTYDNEGTNELVPAGGASVIEQARNQAPLSQAEWL